MQRGTDDQEERAEREYIPTWHWHMVCRAGQGKYNLDDVHILGLMGSGSTRCRKRERKRHRIATHAQSVVWYGACRLYLSESTHGRSGNERKKHPRGNPSPPPALGSHLRPHFHFYYHHLLLSQSEPY